MTRKRFKKLLMSKGFSRNHAEALADRKSRGSYSDYYNSSLIKMFIRHKSGNVLGFDTKALNEGIANATKAFRAFGAAMSEMLARSRR